MDPHEKRARGDMGCAAGSSPVASRTLICKGRSSVNGVPIVSIANELATGFLVNQGMSMTKYVPAHWG